MKKILVVDDNPAEQYLLQSVLEGPGNYQVFKAKDGRAALEQAEQSSPDAVLLDVRLPGLGGLEVLQQLKQAYPRLPVIMITGLSDVQTAVQAIKHGAYNYLTKPFEDGQLLNNLRLALEPEKPAPETKEKGPALARLIGKSPAIQEVLRQLRKVANSNLTVLIEGATGTGKEPTARSLHEESTRRAKPFVALDCGALPESLLESELFGHEKGSFSGAYCRKSGQIELAEGGTLFLDEIGNLPLALQAKLLRVLEERQVRPVGAAKAFPINVRFIAATNFPLREAARAGRFREDLYYRLSEFVLHLPPLCDRKEDLLPLVSLFQEEASAEFQRPIPVLGPGAADRLLAYSWPGNVRQLRNVMRQAVLMAHGPEIEEEQIQLLLERSCAPDPSTSSGQASSPQTGGPLAGTDLKKIAENAVGEAEKQAIQNTLHSTQGNKSQAAKVLGVDYKTLRMKIKKYGLQMPTSK